MHEHRLIRLIARCLLTASLALGACGDGTMEDVGQTSSEIVNGTAVSGNEANSWGLVALYHRTPTSTGGPGPWYGRPCSAMILAHRVNTAYVLTSRHCITDSGEVDGKVVPASWLMVAAGAAPGLPNPNPPTSAKPVLSTLAMSISASVSSELRDAAILAVTAPEWASLANRKGVQMAPAISGVSLTGYGYGLNVRNENCYGNGTVTTGAGTLRKGIFTSRGGSPVGQAGSYRYRYNSSGQSIICGDSGGPDIGNIAPDMFWSSVHGVHALDDFVLDETTSTAPGPWASSMMEGFWLTPMSSTAQNLTRRIDGVMYLDNRPFGTPLVYNAVAKTIRHEHEDGSDCLDWDSGINSFVLTTCNTAQPRQTWEVTSRGYVRNPASNLCMRHMVSGWVEMRTCPLTTASQPERARFTWVWHAQN